MLCLLEKKSNLHHKSLPQNCLETKVYTDIKSSKKLKHVRPWNVKWWTLANLLPKTDVAIFFKEIDTFNQQGWITLIHLCYNATKDWYFNKIIFLKALPLQELITV